MTTFNAASAIQKPLIEVRGIELGSMQASRWSTLVDQLHGLGLIKTKPSARDLMY
jgi:hypothetical protein